MTTESVPPSGIIESPESALFYVEQNLYDAGDPSSCFAVSVHLRDFKTYCNFWVRSRQQWRRLIDERAVDDPEPEALYLVGELNRLALHHPGIFREIEQDIRLNLGLRALMSRAARVANQ